MKLLKKEDIEKEFSLIDKMNSVDELIKKRNRYDEQERVSKYGANQIVIVGITLAIGELTYLHDKFSIFYLGGSILIFIVLGYLSFILSIRTNHVRKKCDRRIAELDRLLSSKHHK